MPEPTPPPVADPPPVPPVGDPLAPPAAAGDPPPVADPPKLSHEEALAELARVRASEAKYRTENTKLTNAQKAAEQAKMTEDEKRTARITELEKEAADAKLALRDKSSYAAVVDAAARLGAAKPAMLHKLIASDIEFDDDGAPKNIDELVRGFLASNPEFKTSAGRPTGDAGQGARSGKTTLTREQLRGMSADDINRAFDSGELAEALRQPGTH